MSWIDYSCLDIGAIVVGWAWGAVSFFLKAKRIGVRSSRAGNRFSRAFNAIVTSIALVFVIRVVSSLLTVEALGALHARHSHLCTIAEIAWSARNHLRGRSWTVVSTLTRTADVCV